MQLGFHLIGGDIPRELYKLHNPMASEERLHSFYSMYYHIITRTPNNKRKRNITPEHCKAVLALVCVAFFENGLMKTHLKYDGFYHPSRLK